MAYSPLWWYPYVFLAMLSPPSSGQLSIPCTDLNPIYLLHLVTQDPHNIPDAIETFYDEESSAHAFKFTQSSSPLHLPSSLIFKYCDYFPEEFSVFLNIKTSAQSQTVSQCVFSLKGHSRMLMGITLYKGSLRFHYTDRLTHRLRMTAFRDVSIFDDKWHTLILTVSAQSAALSIDCGKKKKKRLKRTFPSLTSTIGTNIYFGNCNENGSAFSGVLNQLFILPGSDAAVQACPLGPTTWASGGLRPEYNGIPQVPVTYADRTWCTWRDSGRLWFDLQSRDLKVCYSGIWQTILSPPEQRRPLHLDYIEWHQDLVTAAPTIDLEVFQIPMEGLFMAAASYSDLERRKQQSAIFKWTDNRFVMYQSLYTLGAQSWEYFNIEDQFYLAVANRGPHRDKPFKSVIYRWSKKRKRFRSFQELLTWTARDIEYFEIDGVHFLAVANHVIDRNHSISSDIYRWDSEARHFDVFQQLPTVGAYDWTHFEMRGYHFLVVANSFTGEPFSTTRTESVIYFWENGQFVPFQSLTTTGATDWEFFRVRSEAFLVVSNAFNFGPHTDENTEAYRANSTVYHFNQYIKQFEIYQEIDTHSAVDWESFRVGNDVYLIVSNTRQDVNEAKGPKERYSSVIYRYRGVEKFVAVHYLDIRPSADWEWFNVEGQVYLVYANAKDNVSQVLKVVYQ